MSVYKNRKGFNEYLRIALTDSKGQQKYLLHHRVLAEIFLPNPQGFLTVNHKDGDKGNNSLSNLEWCSYQDNLKHAVKEKLNVAQRGAKSHASKLTPRDVVQIKELLAKGVSQQKVADAFKVSRGCVLGIYTGKTWKNLKECLHEETRDSIQRKNKAAVGQPSKVVVRKNSASSDSGHTRLSGGC